MRRFLGGLTRFCADLAYGRSVLWTALLPTAVRLRLRRGVLDAGLKPRSTSEASATANARAKANTGVLRFAQNDGRGVVIVTGRRRWRSPTMAAALEGFAGRA